MKFKFISELKEPVQIKYFFQHLDLPRGFTTAVKFNGEIRLNNQIASVRAMINPGDELLLIAPDEKGHDTVIPSYEPIEIVFEDEDLLIVNKPANLVSIPSIKDPDSAMANRVKGYYLEQDYLNQVIHIVTRLDRDTTGLMLIAKHRLAHALMDRQIQKGEISKFYYALTTKTDWQEPHGIIDQPIARCDTSIITRMVNPSGKRAITEFWVKDKLKNSTLIKLQLHTGRTHQIRVHLSYLGGPLIGDDLYGGPLTETLNRQALHCGELRFIHPFTQQEIVIRQALPMDMQRWINQNK